MRRSLPTGSAVPNISYQCNTSCMYLQHPVHFDIAIKNSQFWLTFLHWGCSHSTCMHNRKEVDKTMFVYKGNYSQADVCIQGEESQFFDHVCACIMWMAPTWFTMYMRFFGYKIRIPFNLDLESAAYIWNFLLVSVPEVCGRRTDYSNNGGTRIWFAKVLELLV